MKNLALSCTQGEEGLWCIIGVGDVPEGWTPPHRMYMKGGGHKAEYRRVTEPRDYLDRLRMEYAALQIKIQALEAWMRKPAYRLLHVDEQDDEKEQLVMMRQYSEILDRRMVRAMAK